MPEACNFIKKETSAQVFPCEFCKISKTTFFYRTPLVATSARSPEILWFFAGVSKWYNDMLWVNLNEWPKRYDSSQQLVTTCNVLYIFEKYGATSVCSFSSFAFLVRKGKDTKLSNIFGSRYNYRVWKQEKQFIKCNNSFMTEIPII